MKQIWLARCGLVVGIMGAIGALAAAPPTSPSGSAVFGTSGSEDARMLRRDATDKAWQVVKQGEKLHGGDTILGMSGAVILSKNKAVELTLLTDLLGRSPFPIIESVVILPSKPQPVDMDVILDRGRINLTNIREKGPAHVRVTVQGNVWDLTLETPQSRVAMEIFGRWATGVPFKLNPGPKDVPAANLILLVLNGEVTVKQGNTQFAMHAPPGPAILEWDNGGGIDPGPRKLESLPDWAGRPKPSAEGEKLIAVRKKLRDALAAKPVGEVLDEFVNSDDALERRFGVLAMGATDDLARLGNALRNAKHSDVWDSAVQALRHWIGRGPGQDQKLYHGLVDVKKVSPVEAETIVSLLHSFGENDLARPETYELLIGYLKCPRLGVRGLALWHLSRLYPPGKDFGFDPLAPQDARDKAVKKWQDLLKKGELPPKSNKDR
jgi:hypothetical protein